MSESNFKNPDFFFPHSTDSLPGNASFGLEIKTTFSPSMCVKVTEGRACAHISFLWPAILWRLMVRNVQ